MCSVPANQVDRLNKPVSIRDLQPGFRVVLRGLEEDGSLTASRRRAQELIYDRLFLLSLIHILDLLEQMLANLNRDLDRCGALQDSHPLLSALLPVFRQELGFGDRKLTITGLVRWCAQNRMIQQAMTIYNEHLAHAMTQGETPYLLVSPEARELLSREPFYARSQREITRCV